MKTGAVERRGWERLRHHYEVEKELAAKLLNSTREERAVLYTRLYDELFQRIKDHPQLSANKRNGVRHESIRTQLQKLLKHCNHSSIYLEIGAGDCQLALAVAERVERVYAVEISNEIIRGVISKENFEIILSEGTSIPIPPGSVDLAYSNQLIEHLHPEDAAEHLQNVWKCLKPGGRYYCVTPNKLTGPHDISRFFDDVATGFHLREYTYSDLSIRMYDAGFKKVYVLLDLKGKVLLRLPLGIMAALERCYAAFPAALRRPIGSSRLVQKILGVEMVGIK